MEIKSRIISHTFRNKYLKYGGTSSNYSSSNTGSSSSGNIIGKWFYEDEDGNLHSKLNFVGDLDVSAYGASDSGSTGTVTIIDNLTSTAIDCALSANMGRYLKELIDGKSSVNSWNDLTDKPIGLTDANITLWIDAANKRHEHSNRTVLDGITSAKITGWDNHLIDAVKHITSAERTNWNNANSHISDSVKHITADERTKWNGAVTNSHTHSNKTVLDGITSALISNWNTAYTNNHNHGNKSVLDGITSAKVSNWDGVVTNWNKAFYFDTDGNLKVKLNLIGEQEVSAYGTGSTGGGGAVTIVDALTSTSTDAALSANQGRVLKSLIDGKISSVGWNDVTGKPATFTPSVHNHTIADVTNLQATLDGKSATSHTHNYASTVKLGTTAYNVVSNVISLPAYPVIPSTIKNPYAITIQANGTTLGSYDGGAAATYNLTYANVGAAAASHTHSYLPLGGGTLTGNVTISTDSYIRWDRNSDYAKIWFKNTSDSDSDSYLGFETGDNGNEYFRWSGNAGGTITEWMSLKGDGLRIKGTLVSLGNHTHNYAGSSSVGGAANSANKVNSTLSFAAGAFTTNTFDGSAAKTINVPTHTSHITNNSGFITTSATVAAANKLATARTINGTNFDGTANITTALWGTARNMSIVSSNGSGASSAVSVNGSGNVSLYLPSTITASLSGNATTATTLQTARTLWGQNFNGTGNISGTLSNVADINMSGTLKFGTYAFNISNVYGSSIYCNYDGNYGDYIDIAPKGAGSNNRYLRVGNNGNMYYDGSFLAANDITTYGVVRSTLQSSFQHRWSYFFNTANGLFSSNVDCLTSAGQSRSILTWKDLINGQGFRTHYTIGSYRDNYKFGRMILAVSNNDDGETYGAAITIDGANGLVTVERNLVAIGEVTAYSDKRLKSNIQPLANRGYITPVSYTKDGKQSIGFIAQEVQELYPELVIEGTDDNKYLSLNYAQYTAVLQAQIIELNKRIEQLEEYGTK